MEDWLYGAVDLLASEYGWSFNFIMQKLFPEDFFLLLRQIKTRKVEEAIMGINIVAAPQNSDDSFIKELFKHRRWWSGEDITPKLDRAGLDALKTHLGQNSKIKTKLK